MLRAWDQESCEVEIFGGFNEDDELQLIISCDDEFIKLDAETTAYLFDFLKNNIEEEAE